MTFICLSKDKGYCYNNNVFVPLYLTSYILHLHGRSSSILGKMPGELDTPKGMRQYGLPSTIHNQAGYVISVPESKIEDTRCVKT